MNLYTQYLNSLNEFESKIAPKELYFEGDFSLLTSGRRVSIVGSRKATPQGLHRAKVVTEELVRNNIIVVSGLAEGIDTQAHISAIANGGRTIAVLGTPLSKAYPAKNKALLDKIKENHLAISQFGEDSATYPSNFPQRNRTMALISDATIIIEATENSGTRHQGWEAIRLGRKVFILENILNDPSVRWAKEMTDYGALPLSKDNVVEELLYLPTYTAEIDFAF